MCYHSFSCSFQEKTGFFLPLAMFTFKCWLPICKCKSSLIDWLIVHLRQSSSIDWLIESIWQELQSFLWEHSQQRASTLATHISRWPIHWLIDWLIGDDDDDVDDGSGNAVNNDDNGSLLLWLLISQGDPSIDWLINYFLEQFHMKIKWGTVTLASRTSVGGQMKTFLLKIIFIYVYSISVFSLVDFRSVLRQIGPN